MLWRSEGFCDSTWNICGENTQQAVTCNWGPVLPMILIKTGRVRLSGYTHWRIKSDCEPNEKGKKSGMYFLAEPFVAEVEDA